MILGVVSLAVMVSVWGLVRFLQSTFGLENSANNTPPPPKKLYGPISYFTPGTHEFRRFLHWSTREQRELLKEYIDNPESRNTIKIVFDKEGEIENIFKL